MNYRLERCQDFRLWGSFVSHFTFRIACVFLVLTILRSTPLRAEGRLLFELPNTLDGPQAQSRQELDAFGWVMVAHAPASIIGAAETFAQNFPNSQLLPLVLIQEMKAEIAVNSYDGALAAGHRLLLINPNNLEALILMAQVLPNFPPSDAGHKDQILAEAQKDIQSAENLLQTFHLPTGISAREFLQNKRRLATSLEEAAGFVDLKGGQYKRSIRKYEWALNHGGDRSAVTSLRLGLAYFYAGNTIEAEKNLKDAMKSQSPLLQKRAAEVLAKISKGTATPNTVQGSN